MSGTGTISAPPNISAADSSLGRWSTVLAVYTFRDPIGLHQRLAVEHPGERVGVGIAEVHGDGVAPVVLDDRRQAALDLGERLVPRRVDELAVAAHQRGAQPVGVLVELLERRSLGADEPVAEHVVTIAADPFDVTALRR